MPTVSGTVTDQAGNVATWSASWATTQPAAPAKRMGMSAPKEAWAARLAEVGPAGITARRIFCDLTSSGRDQSALIEQALAASMLPVISYKEPLVNGSRDVVGLVNGAYDGWLANAKAYLTGLGAEVVATFHHEPHGDMTASLFRQGSQKFLDLVKAPTIRVGPILNGWLLDNQVSTFAGYTSAALLDQWDFVGVDTYQPGDVDNPDNTKMPGRAIPILANWLASWGYSSMPIVVGEYNGFTAEAITAAGNFVLNAPTVSVACVWNSTGGLGVPLSGDRLTAYQVTKADSRVRQ